MEENVGGVIKALDTAGIVALMERRKYGKTP